MARKNSDSNILWGLLGAVGVFAAMCLGGEKTVTVALMVAALGAGLLCFSRLRRRGNLPLVLMAAITALGGASMFYGISGKFALQGFCPLMNGLCVAMLMILAAPEEDSVTSGATALAGAGALVTLISLDHLSTRLISAPVLKLLSQVANGYVAVSGVEAQVRMTSIFDAPNVFAGCVGIGLLLSLGLVKEKRRKDRAIPLMLLYVNLLGFLLAFSLGATASMAAALLVYVLFENTGKRASMMEILVRTLAVAALVLIPISKVGLGGWTGFQILPLGAMILGGGVLLVTDRLLPEGKRPLFKGCFLWIPAVALVAALAIAMTWTGGISLEEGQSLRRAAYPQAGTYQIQGETDGPVTVRIEGQNLQQAMMHTQTVLYEGAVEGAKFTVPDEILVVYFTFRAEEDLRLEQVRWHGAYDEGKLPLDYRLLPEFIENRLQGILANENAIQRIVFFKDGLKLWKRSPVAGLGLGSFETALFTVQEFFYETKYVHNHYIQTLLETGILGLALFVGLLLTGGMLLFRKRAHPFAPALAAALVFMALHGAVEVVFSSAHYLPLAFGTFGLMGLLEGNKKGKWRPLLPVVTVLLFLPVLVCNLWAGHVGKNAMSLEDLHRAARLDPIEWTDYAISYVANVPADAAEPVLAQGEEYAQRLAGETSNTLHYYLAQYYFRMGNVERAMEMAKEQARATISSSPWWNTVFALVYEHYDGSETCRRGLAELVDMMDAWNMENMGTIVLEDQVRQALDWMLGG